MKRKPDILKVSAIKPLIFWQQCDGCEFEFRREYGWKVFGRLEAYSNYIIRHYCIDCCPTAEEARIKVNYIPSKPPPPPAPPPPRIVKSIW